MFEALAPGNPSGQSLGRPIRAEIDCTAYLRNLTRLQSLAQPARVVAVLKADAYGHGVEALAQLLAPFSSDNLASSEDPSLLVDIAVASADEAKTLVDRAVPNRIWVLEGPFSLACLGLKAAQPIQWVVHSLWQLELIQAHQGVQDCWLKVDSGMHRLGLNQEDLIQAKQLIDGLDHCRLMGVMTHFACSDEEDSMATPEQQAQFETVLQAADLSGVPRSLSNSSAIFNFNASHADFVRPGIATYCSLCLSSNHGNRSHNTEAVMTLKSAVIALRSLEPGEAVGYGQTWRAKRPSVIATVAVGYGDGYPRHAPNGTPVLIEGVRAPLVGRVSMDMITVDVTDLAEVRVGSNVELWGKALDINEVAELSGTISYELLTKLTQRVPKVYFGSSM